MTWNTLTDLAAGQIVNEGHMDDIRENIEHGGDNVQIGGVALKTLTTPTSATRMATGTYTGDGNATQGITGVGFQPDFIGIYLQATSGYHIQKSDQDGTKSFYNYGGVHSYQDDYIISLDSDGFTVGDGTGGSVGNQANVNTSVYAYVAWIA